MFQRLLLFGLLVVFAAAVIGCGTGELSMNMPMHDEPLHCSSMFSDELAIPVRELGSAVAFALLAAATLFISVWVVAYLQRLVSEHRFVHILLRARSKLLRLHDHILRQFSSGILHPQIY